jgi:curli biogenesis system outer membrane secretion channel CsgG
MVLLANSRKYQIVERKDLGSIRQEQRFKTKNRKNLTIAAYRW